MLNFQLLILFYSTITILFVMFSQDQKTGQDNDQKNKNTQSFQPFSQQAPAQISSNMTYDPDLLIFSYDPQYKKQLKAENLEYYKLKTDSPIYSFSLNYLYKLIKKYPDQFTPQLSAKFQNKLKQAKRTTMIFLGLGTAGVLYWTLSRNRTWFKLTGNAIWRIYYLSMCFVTSFEQREYAGLFFYHTIYQNKTDLQKCIQRHQLNAGLISPQQMFEKI